MLKEQLSNNEQREIEETKLEQENNKWTINRIWEEYKNQNSNLKSLSIDENRFKNHIRPALGDKEPSDICPFDIDKIRVTLLKTHKPQSVKHVLELIRRTINFEIEKQLCEGLTFKIQLPKVNNQKTEEVIFLSCYF